MDQPHQGKKPPKPARVGGPHSGRRKPDFDDTDEQLREHRQRQSPSLEEAARRVEKRIGADPQVDREATPPRLKVHLDGSLFVALERECSTELDSGEHTLWHVRCSEGESILEAESNLKSALIALEACVC